MDLKTRRLSWVIQYSQGSLKMGQEAEEESVSEGCDMTHLTIIGLEDPEPRIQCLWRLDRPGNSFSPKAPMKEYSPANTLTLGQ